MVKEVDDSVVIEVGACILGALGRVDCKEQLVQFVQEAVAVEVSAALATAHPVGHIQLLRRAWRARSIRVFYETVEDVEVRIVDRAVIVQVGTWILSVSKLLEFDSVFIVEAAIIVEVSPAKAAVHPEHRSKGFRRAALRERSPRDGEQA